MYIYIYIYTPWKREPINKYPYVQVKPKVNSLESLWYVKKQLLKLTSDLGFII